MTTYYVATDGNDSDPGTEAEPWLTITYGVGQVSAGDMLYIRGGSYHELAFISANGTEGNEITIKSYTGETAIIDGEGDLPVSQGSYLLKLSGDYIIVEDLEVDDSNQGGVLIEGDYCELNNLTCHHIDATGISITGDYNIVDNCTVYRTNEDNENGVSETWGAALTTRDSSYNTFKNNIVYNNWGEGVSTIEADNTTIEDNIIYDNWAVQLYIDNAPYTLVQRNLVYHTGDNEFEVDSYPRDPCIGVADEEYNGKDARNDYLTIINNLTIGGSRAFLFWKVHADSGLKNSIIAHNTFANALHYATFRIATGEHDSTVIKNNIILQEDALAVADVPADADLTFSYNLWSKSPDSDASGAGDVVDDPQLVKSGPAGPGLLTPEWFKILPSSPALGRAQIIAEVAEDFFRNPRGSSPDIGAHEYFIITGGTLRSVRIVTASELKINGGRFTLQQGPAIKVRGYKLVEAGATKIKAGDAQPIYVLADTDIKSGGGRWKVNAGPAIQVTDVIDERGVIQGHAIPVYPVDDDGNFDPTFAI